MRRVVIVMVLSSMVGCASLDRPKLTQFEPTRSGFRYAVGAASYQYPVDSESAERTRMDWLETYLKEEEVCPTGYEMVSREVRQVGVGGQIVYVGRCK